MARSLEDRSGVIGVDARGRRRFTAEFKRRIVELTFRPGASVAGVALAHGINANPLFKWRQWYRREGRVVAGEGPVWLPVAIAPAVEPADAEAGHEPAPPDPGRIEIEVAGARLRVTGAVDPATLRAVLAGLRGR